MSNWVFDLKTTAIQKFLGQIQCDDERHDYAKPYIQSTVLSGLKDLYSYWFSGWTWNVWSAEVTDRVTEMLEPRPIFKSPWSWIDVRVHKFLQVGFIWREFSFTIIPCLQARVVTFLNEAKNTKEVQHRWTEEGRRQQRVDNSTDRKMAKERYEKWIC